MIDRRTPYGFGIPMGDMRTFSESAFYDHIEQQWKCLICGYKKTNSNGTRYSDTLPLPTGTPLEYQMGDGGIRIHDKYGAQEKITNYEGAKPYMIEELNNNRISAHQKENGHIKWRCGYCGAEYDREKV